MQLTMFEPAEASPPQSSFGKTSQASFQRVTTPSGAFWLGLPEKMSRFNRQGKNGRTLVVCMDPRGQSLGGPWTPNISDWPNDADVCSLSQVLETGSIPQRYFLSGTACAGLLRRQDRRPCLFVSRQEERDLSMTEKLTLLKKGAGFDT